MPFMLGRLLKKISEAGRLSNRRGVMSTIRRTMCAIQILFICSLILPWGLGAAPDPKVIEAAKKEGQLVWYNTLVQPHAQGLIDAFTKKYPFIRASFWRGSATGVYSKLMLEARAGRYEWDTVSLTSPEFVSDLKQRNLIAAYASPEREMFSDDVKDQQGY